MENTRHARDEPRGDRTAHESSDISRQPGEQRARAPKSSAGPARSRPAAEPGGAHRGPGGLGYILALEEEEAREIDWHEEDRPHAPPAPRQGH